MLIGAGDVIIASHHSLALVAAIGIANGLVNPFMIFGHSMTMGISPLVAKKLGEGQQQGKLLWTCCVYALVCVVPCMIFAYIVSLFVPMMGFDEEIAPLVQRYSSLVIWSFPGNTLFGALKEYLQAYDNIRVSNTLAAAGIFLNLLFNTVFVFGYFGLPEMGIDGLILSTILIRTLLGLGVLLYASRRFSLRGAFDIVFFKECFSFSLSIAFTFFWEVLAFSVLAP